MDKATVLLLAQYNEQVNRQMNSQVSELEPVQWKQALGGYYPSIESLCNHIYIADFIWLKRFAGLRDLSYSQDPLFQGDLTLSDTAFTSRTEYLERRPVLDSLISSFAGELSDRDLSSDLVYRNSRGQEFTKGFSGLVLHMFNHQTHHRGMISLYLDQLGIQNDFSNLFHLV